MRLMILLAFTAALGFTALLIWRTKHGQDGTVHPPGFRPRMGFSRLDGMTSLALLLPNDSSTNIWVEEVEIFLTELRAYNQAREASCHETQKIRQLVRPRDLLPLSLTGLVYKAAGEPQRKYSCVLSSVLRYRIGEEEIEKVLENYRLRMMGLTASGIRRERGPVRRHPSDKPPEIRPVETRSK